MNKQEKYGPSETVLKAQKGDRDAIARLFEDYQPMLKRAVSASVRGLEDVGYTEEDLMQEAGVALTSAINTYDPDRGFTFGAYARRCVRNRLVSVARSAKRVRKVGGVPTAQESDSPFVSVSLEMVQMTLTAYEREVFALLCAGYKPGEIARRLSRPAKSVYNAVVRIKAKVKKQME